MTNDSIDANMRAKALGAKGARPLMPWAQVAQDL